MTGDLHPKHFHVLIPCHNCENYIGPCLESLQAQTFQNWSALVTDDGSTDATVEKVKPFLADPRISMRRGEKRQYLMGNTLAGLHTLDHAPSDVVAILDGDDLLMVSALETLWDRHMAGYDLVYTDEEIQDQPHSIGRAPIGSVSIREQLWCFSQLRSFKAYLFQLLSDGHFKNPLTGGYFRAAGDLALYLPMAELAGFEKICFVPEKLYYYRVHESCNFKVMREEQLSNNRFIRSRPALARQRVYFDHTLDLAHVDKAGLPDLARETRDRFPKPRTVCLRHHIFPEEQDAWRAYHDLWIEEGVFLSGVVSARVSA